MYILPGQFFHLLGESLPELVQDFPECGTPVHAGLVADHDSTHSEHQTGG